MQKSRLQRSAKEQWHKSKRKEEATLHDGQRQLQAQAE
jgi:hypothetical protein